MEWKRTPSRASVYSGGWLSCVYECVHAHHSVCSLLRVGRPLLPHLIMRSYCSIIARTHHMLLIDVQGGDPPWTAMAVHRL